MSTALVTVGELSPVGLRLPEGLSYEDWQRVGEQLLRTTRRAVADRGDERV